MKPDFPKSFQDIPKHYAFKGKKMWTILDGNKRVSGELTLTEEQVKLDIEMASNRLDEFKGKRFAKTTGLGDKDSRITLINSYAHEDYMSLLFNRISRPVSKVTLSPALVVIHYGTHKTPDEVSNITGYLPGVGEWFGDDFLEFDYNEYKFKNTKLIYHEIPIIRDIKIILKSRLAIDHESLIIDKKFLAYTESFVTIEYGETETDKVENSIRIFSHVENFFNFIFRTPNTTHMFMAEAKHSNKDEKYYIISADKKKDHQREDKSHGNSPLFKFHDVSNVNNIFMQWVLEYDKIHEIVDTLILLKSTAVSEEMRFTSIINSLESVHRRYHDSKLQSDDDYAKRVDGILEKLDSDDKEFVKGSLQHGNEQNLRKRLNEVYKIGESYGIKKPTKTFRNKVIATRNYFTHGDQAGELGIFPQYELSTANGLLAQYIKLVLLEVLGVRKEELVAIVTNSPQFKQFYRDEPTVNRSGLQ